ncbi:hypothetical protein BKA56DRAFT_99299 [Ilyonectria sp. MPI-CAGE-AT-0026]|nr:hypothetical protein BKA56DRAFT_99299 [Ilyonectria sp. MPI-CAGE-AT-0026]
MRVGAQRPRRTVEMADVMAMAMQREGVRRRRRRVGLRRRHAGSSWGRRRRVWISGLKNRRISRDGHGHEGGEESYLCKHGEVDGGEEKEKKKKKDKGQMGQERPTTSGTTEYIGGRKRRGNQCASRGLHPRIIRWARECEDPGDTRACGRVRLYSSATLRPRHRRADSGCDALPNEAHISSLRIMARLAARPGMPSLPFSSPARPAIIPRLPVLSSTRSAAHGL